MPALRRLPYAPFTQRALRVIRGIPRGRVATYGLVAAAAGSPLAARQVVRILHSLSRKERLPWHRVIGGRGAIRLPRGLGFETQRALLRKEGVAVTTQGRVDLARYLWKPTLSDD
ncbi:MAG TPA: MGMT family protein [Spirochaetia bacterium]|nr:MGMT family protein [Spirochaetia bacterium]